MVILIGGTTHTGKTFLSQKLLERYKFPYLSIDHIKMGLIRSGNTDLTVEDDEKLTPYLWKIVSEIIKTAIENNQNLIIEGVYIPFGWEKSLEGYLENIRYYCLIMTRDYIENNFDKILENSDVIEKRLEDIKNREDFLNLLIEENEKNLKECKKYGYNYILIDKKYDVEEILEQIKF